MNTPLHEFEKLYFRICAEIEDDDQKVQSLLKLFHDIVSDLSESSSLHFYSLFARVSYITSRYQFSPGWSFAFQVIRKELKSRLLQSAEVLPIVKGAIEYLISICNYETADGKTISIPKLPKLPPTRSAGRFKKRFARVTVVEWDKELKILTAIDEESPDQPCYIHYCVEGTNDIFCDTLELTLQEAGLPMVIGLTNVETTHDNHYIPSFIVVMPDLLMDVTSIAQVLPSGSDPHAVNLMELFLPSDSTEAILTGQVANFFLDELIRDTQLSYQDLFIRSFKIYPVEFVLLSNDRVKHMHAAMRSHFDNILNVINHKFPGVGIDRLKCVIEPSYFSPEYGIKGRLDLYYCHEEEQAASIVELKSGRPFKPNSYGLSNSNYHQTLLYELLIKSVHGPRHHRANFILYSCTESDTLRFAVSVESLQKEAIQNRNELVLLHLRMLQLDTTQGRDIFGEITSSRYPELKGFVKTNIQTWENVYSGLSEGEKNYFKFFAAYITREHMLARIGHDSVDGASGLAALWLESVEAKEEKYQLLRAMELASIRTVDNQTILTFNRNSNTNPLANFRGGDIAILYPFTEEEGGDPTKHQLHRANILSVDADNVVLRLRNNQIHTDQLSRYKLWNIEHDLLDSSFRGLYQSLWNFMSADISKRQFILGLKKPDQQSRINPMSPPGLTEQQTQIFNEGLYAGQLYLLWGPPGTGKTSKMLKSWVEYYFNQTDLRIVLLAYTNKAVDEICHTLAELGSDVVEHYLRIGSKTGTGEAYKCRLLDTVIEPMKSRKEIKQLLDHTRIFVATVAAFQGKSELFRLVQFDLAIVDEASQILEPTMTGLMTHFKKTILIGDHMQLPAISTQPEKYSQVTTSEAWPTKIGLTDLSMSYFERLYRLYQSKGWVDMIGVLNEQGRMHFDIQQYANDYVYGGLLNCLHEDRQNILLSNVTGDHDGIFNDRMIFIPCTSEVQETYLKTNRQEADLVIEIISQWQEKIAERQLKWNIGVITPFRAQIAAIHHQAHLSQTNMTNVLVDTVERFQGGARDIIIMSAAVNNRSALQRIVSKNAEGIDRKLNVAVTRARQQFILLGNNDILENETSYKVLIGMSNKLAPAGINHKALVNPVC